MSNDLVIKNDSFIQSIHNTIDCISLVDAKRPNDRCWFTAKQIQDWTGMSKTTLWRKLDILISKGRLIDNSKIISNMVSFKNETHVPEQKLTDIMVISLTDESNTPHDTKIYNLNVLNHLAMIEYDNDKLNEIANKFSDILSEVETTGSYNAIQLDRKTQLQLAIINSKPNSVEQLSAIAALEELHAEEKKALEDQNRALEAENKDLHDTNDEIFNENEIIRGKYHNTKQIYDIIMQEYPEALQQAKSTNYNKLRKALKKLSNEDKESVKIYKKHVTNKKGDIEWRKEYYFVHEILLKILDCVRYNIKYIANVR